MVWGPGDGVLGWHRSELGITAVCERTGERGPGKGRPEREKRIPDSRVWLCAFPPRLLALASDLVWHSKHPLVLCCGMPLRVEDRSGGAAAGGS